jgi:hypothetical protein
MRQPSSAASGRCTLTHHATFLPLPHTRACTTPLFPWPSRRCVLTHHAPASLRCTYAQISEAFEIFDSNKDGKIDYYELKVCQATTPTTLFLRVRPSPSPSSMSVHPSFHLFSPLHSTPLIRPRRAQASTPTTLFLRVRPSPSPSSISLHSSFHLFSPLHSTPLIRPRRAKDSCALTHTSLTSSHHVYSPTRHRECSHTRRCACSLTRRCA